MPVTVYTRTSCGPCKTVKFWLTKKGISFEEKNVDDHPELLGEVFEKSGYQMVPVTLIGEHVVTGANFGLLTKLLAVRNLTAVL